MVFIIFLNSLYQDCENGFLYLWVLQTKKTYWFKVSQLEKMYKKALELTEKKQDVYFGVGIAEDPKFNGRASSKDIIGIPGIWIDIDVKGKDHVQENLPETVQEILNKLPLEPSIIVNSGHGLHAYWLFKEFWYFENEKEAVEAQKLLQGFQLFIKQRLGYKLDSTHDLARVLRLPDTFNYKSEPVKVEILKTSEVRYNPDDLAQYAIEIEENTYDTRNTNFERRPTDRTSEELFKHCKFIQYCKDNATSLSYQEWLAMISNVVRCSDGEKAVHELSKPYPKYSPKETDSKIIECLNKMHGPMSCKYIGTYTAFTGCPVGGCGVKAPCSFALSKKFAQEEITLEPTIVNQNQKKVMEALTDLGNAERFSRMFGDRLKFCHQFGKWLIWDGTRHKLDETEQVMQFAKKVVRSFREDMKDYSGSEMYDKIQKHATRSESLSRLKAMVELAQHMLAVHVDDLDNDDWLLNVKNGVIDLKTGELLQHSKDRLITKIAPVEYQKDADCPQFKKFMQDVFVDNPEIVPFMQKYLGYSLTGDTSEQVMAFGYGAMGSNGKSTLMELIMNMLGDYGETSSSDTFTLKRNEGIPNDIARLRGSRFVKISELKENTKLNEALIKQITGNDKLTARFLRQEFFTFLPTFKLMILTNHKPRLTGDDPALWRRIILIPFMQQFTGDRKDKKLPEKLRKEFPGILNWCIEGCLKWQKEGLNPPACVLQATREYQAESDVINNWIEDCCVVAPNIISKTADLFNSYEEWCKENAEFVSMPRRSFTNKLIEKGFKLHKRNGIRCIIGIGLIDKKHAETLYENVEPY